MRLRHDAARRVSRADEQQRCRSCYPWSVSLRESSSPPAGRRIMPVSYDGFASSRRRAAGGGLRLFRVGVQQADCPPRRPRRRRGPRHRPCSRRRCGRFPGDALGIVHPGLVRAGVAAGGRLLLMHRLACAGEAAGDGGQLGVVLDLDAQVIDALAGAAAGDREVHARVSPASTWRSRSSAPSARRRTAWRRTGRTGSRSLTATDDVQALHGGLLLIGNCDGGGGLQAAPTQSSGRPWQQSSVR